MGPLLTALEIVMKLAAFIHENTEGISIEWENFASTLLPEADFSKSALRDGITGILKEIASDMDRQQTAQEQQDKSEGSEQSGTGDSPAETHALARVRMGLSSAQLISEFRALRASVIRLWHAKNDIITSEDVYDITRFNEAIDQALTEAEVRYSKKVQEGRELFLGILGHDLRSPLNAISGFSQLMLSGNLKRGNINFAEQIIVSAGRMSHMITDLIELTRVQIGEGISIKRMPTDLAETCKNVLAEMKAIYPDRELNFEGDAWLEGDWDEARISQLLGNLVGNAIQHGDPDHPVKLKAEKTETGIKFLIHNQGTTIPLKILPNIFERFIQGKAGSEITAPSTSLGLGLYIAKEIAIAHGGTISARSTDEEGTYFEVNLPTI